MHILAISPGEGYDARCWRAVLGAGIDALLIREKQLDARPLLDLARRVQDLAPHLELWLAGRLDVALAAGCGLHAPERHPDVDPALLPLSRPLHDPAQFQARAGARQLILSPIFPVPGKGAPWGAAKLCSVLDALPPAPTRLLALGGIGPANAASLRHSRLAGVALIRSLWNDADPAGVVGALRATWEGPAAP